jgi:pimeloyl-ACP methyl ester carboxylesterase
MQYQLLQTYSGMVGYVKVGHGRPLVMVLRYGATLYNWDQTFIHELSKKFTLYLIDPPLVGKTTGNISPTITGYATLVRDFLLGISLFDAILLGWSFGGAVVQEFAKLFPNLLNSIIFLSAFSDSRLSNPEFIELQMGNEELSKDKKIRIFELMYSEKLTPELVGLIGKSGLSIDNYNYRLNHEARNFHNQFVLSWPGSTRAGLNAITVPTLVLRSRNDLVFNFAAVEAFIKDIPNSKLIEYPKGGHLFLHYHGKETAQDIINYFK